MKILCQKNVNPYLNSVVKIKHLLLLLLLASLNRPTIAQTNKQVVLFSIKEDIAPSATRLTVKALNAAKEKNAAAVIILMDTYGGLVNDADSIRKLILEMPMPVYVLIENNAASAGALISLACDKIYMREGSSIGAATVVNQTGEAAPDKYQSYMRGKMRATAEAQGKDTIIKNGDTLIRFKRNPLIAEAMVDPNVVVEGLVDSTKVVTLTPDEAMKYGFCEGIASDYQQVLKQNNLEQAEIITVEKSTLDKIIGFFANPAVSSILLLVIFGGIYFELQTPGIGFPLLAAAIAGLLYLVPLYLEGLAANWEIMLIICGLALLLVEIFAIPGFGIAGISGIGLLLVGLFLSLLNNVNFDFSQTTDDDFTRALMVITFALVGAIVLIFTDGRQLLKSRLFKRLVLADTQEGFKANPVAAEIDLTGRKAIAFTDIRPFGKVLLDDELIEVKTLGVFVSKGSEVTLTKKELNYWLIEN